MHRSRCIAMDKVSNMSDNTMKIFKVWNVNKTTGSLLGAQKLEELKMKVESKFEISSSEFHISLSDGCKVEDEDAFQLLTSGSELFVLTTGQSLSTGSANSASSSLNDSDFSSSSSPRTNLLTLVENIRKRKTSLNVKKPAIKKAKTSMKINIGWLHFDNSQNKYQQVKLKTGGGSRTVDMCVSSSYKDILDKAIDIFFPGGVSSKGRIENFSRVLGNFKQDLLKEEGFSLEQYVKTSCLSSKPRVYLMTKEMIEQELPSLFQLLSDDSSEDFYLPDIYSTPSTPQSNDTEQTSPAQSAVSVETTGNAPAIEMDSNTPNAGTPAIETDSNTPNAGTPAIETDSNTPNAGTPAIETDSNTPNAGTLTNTNEAGLATTTNNEAGLVTYRNQMFETNPYSNDSPVSLRMPRIPTCTICSDRFSDAFLNCGHILCFVCATELTERGSICHICRKEFTTVSQLYY